MASSTYTALLNTVSTYVDKAKAEEVLGRQLPNSGQTADTLNVDGLKKIVAAVSGSLSLYVADAAKRAELMAAIKKMAP